MTEKEIFYTMLEMQKSYDRDVFEAHNLRGYDEIIDRIGRAMLDELGELNHELKSSWCWWKNTQKQIDDAKVLEEFADVVHFCLCWVNATPSKHTDPYIEHCLEAASCNYPHDAGMRDMIGGLLCAEPIRILRAGKKMLGLSWDQIYDAYCAKHETNLNRVASGY